jgi:pectin methylesterase-like acyl-CoA thioesterase
MSKFLITFTLALLLAAGASAQSVFVVAPVAGPGVFSTDIQPAVDAAANGDLVLVKAGTYSGFTIDAKGVSVIADAGAAAVANGLVFVSNVSASQRVLLSTSRTRGSPWPTRTASAATARLRPPEAEGSAAPACAC